MSFGSPNFISFTDVMATAIVIVQCGPNVPFSVGIDNGQNFTTQRRVRSAAFNYYLDYDIYSDAARTRPWGTLPPNRSRERPP